MIDIIATCPPLPSTLLGNIEVKSDDDGDLSEHPNKCDKASKKPGKISSDEEEEEKGDKEEHKEKNKGRTHSRIAS
jgi:hypothetical protein